MPILVYNQTQLLHSNFRSSLARFQASWRRKDMVHDSPHHLVIYANVVCIGQSDTFVYLSYSGLTRDDEELEP